MTCVLTMVAAAASATTIVMPTDEQLIAKSPVIVTGTILSTNAVERDGAIYTEASVTVESAIKGQVAQTITVRELGGETNGRFSKVFGAAELKSGERVMLFLESSPKGGYRTIDLFVGKLTEGRQLDGRRLWLRDDIDADVVMLDANFEPVHSTKNVQRDAVKFETFVVDRIAGRAGVRNYGVENPVLAKPGTTGGARENFTLLAEPQVYRWGRFDTGGAANWFSGGSQPGYSGGGVNEMSTAMAAWTNFSQAKILYSYSGVRSGNFGGLSASNGVNEVLFNDPLNEISGTFTGSGVVGTGGFSGVGSVGTWNAPFAADATHTAGAKTAYNISEGNLTIQDGVTSSNMSSNRLAEIISHEFGHTLGFGHSESSGALMYAFVTGAGPSLRTDDQTAARWLYPNGTQTGGGGGGGGGTTTVPSAPSNLLAAAAGASVALSWTDNATNETSQSIYYATATGSFTKVADVNANVTGTTLSGFTGGSYRFYVNASNSAGTSANSNIATATVATQLTARFSYTPFTGNVGTNFTFLDESLGTVTSRVWNFGDGASATTTNAQHGYTRSGVYTVTLTVSSNGASSQVSHTVSVTNALTPAFNWSPASPTTNDDVTFLDQSTGGVTSWYWTFGDGTISQQQNPSKRFAAPGSYPVTLSITRGTEAANLTKTIFVANGAPTVPAVNAAFDASTSTPSVGENVTFTDRSSGSPTTWIWSFGDGSTSTAQNPVHSYGGPGTYTVSLYAANSANSSTAIKSITVASLPPYRSLISAAAQQNGIGGTSWRTELSLFNAGTQGASVTALFIPAAGGTMVTRSIFLGPRQSIIYANTLLDLFGIANGAGAVAVEATSAGSAAQLRITSRTFTNGSLGTYGQSVPDVKSGDLTTTLYLTGIQSNASYRTNIGLVNRGNNDVGATLTLFDANGGTVSTANVTIPANNFQQSSLSSYFPETAGRSYNALSMRVTMSASDAVTAYASILDNLSQDPVYVQAMPGRGGNSMTIPVVARANGANGTFWRSDVMFFNPSNARIFLSVRYSDTTKTLSLGARETFLLADVLTQFGYGQGGNPLLISWSGNSAPVVSSRTYTTDERGGTFGQSIDPVEAFGNEQFVPGLRSDVSYRSNLGVLNGGSDAEELTVTLLSPAGFELASTKIVLQPGEGMQQAVTALFPSISASTGSFTLYVRGDANAKVFAYGSMIDNASGDPVFFAGK
ncbi:MAG TPA: PKD domain-containing protein [Thermoanaerobaculia bacterium]|nr:PKD domain-containing protein [Thermoanaerobaculia bacterium]